MAGTRILLRGHYNPTNWSRKYPNLQLTRTPEGQRVLACTQCIRTFGKTARIDKKQKDKAAKKVSDAAKRTEAAAKKADLPANLPAKVSTSAGASATEGAAAKPAEPKKADSAKAPTAKEEKPKKEPKAKKDNKKETK